jgi:hypothetical protein
MWDIELTPMMGGDVLAGTKATVRSTDFVRVLTGETALRRVWPLLGADEGRSGEDGLDSSQ